MKVKNGFVINVATSLVNNYHISPFNINETKKNSVVSVNNIDKAKEYLLSRFGNYLLTKNGKSALNISLSKLNLHSDDVVTIFTTSGNFYISGCVTKEIEKFCKWSRNIENNTKVILVNNEFGYVYKGIETLKEYNLPIIEDCAHSFISQNKNNTIGKIGDFVIYSLPKFFSVQFGGLLVSSNNTVENSLKENEQKYLLSCIGRNISFITDIKNKRLDNYCYLKEKMNALGLTPTFRISEFETPGVFMFNIENIDLNQLKVFCQRNGIESSVFYGRNAFFIPVHQNLTKFDLNYFIEVIKKFINENS